MKKLLSLLLLTVACCNVSTQGDPTPNIVVPDSVNYCAAGCAHLQTLPGPDGKLGCLESRDLKMNDGGVESCTQFCTITEQNGRDIEPKCWTTLQSCDEIESCRKDN